MSIINAIIDGAGTFFDKSVFFSVALSITGYQIGLLCKKKFRTALANPLLIAIVFVIAALWLLRVDYGIYKTGAQYLTYLLTPATVCLAIPLYSQLEKFTRHWKAIMAGVAAGAAVNLPLIFAFAALFRFSHQQYVTFLPKSITTAIGIGVSAELGGTQSVTVAAIITTGLIGNIAGEKVLNLLRVKESVARGIAIGTGAHAIGTAKAFEMGEVEGAMSSLAIVVNGFLTVALAPLFANLL